MRCSRPTERSRSPHAAWSIYVRRAPRISVWSSPPNSRRIGAGATHEETTTATPERDAAYTGPGRRRGSLNRRTIELRALLGSLCHDIDYQDRLRQDFKRRRVHPAIESLAWGHVIGKPAERVQVSTDVTMNQKLAEERELFGRLSVAQLEELATDSAALIAKARLMARSQQVPPAGARLTGVPVEGSERSDAGGPKFTGPDVDCSGNTKRPFEASGAQSRRTLVLVDSPSPAAGGDHVVTGERAEPSTTAAVPDDQDAASGVTVPPEGR